MKRVSGIRSTLIRLITAASVLVVAAGPLAADFDSETEGLTIQPGLIPHYLDHEKGRFLALLPAADTGGLVSRLLMASGITEGLGSNPVGLDRNRIGETRVVALRAAAGRVFAEVENSDFRASAGGYEAIAARQSFAKSVIWSGEVLGTGPGGALLVDLSGLFTADRMGLAARLSQVKEGSFSVDGARSWLKTKGSLSFPDNIEIDAVLTFKGAKPGREVRSVTPVPTALTLVQHTSLIRLPDDGYQPRRYDPRAGQIGTTHIDMSQPLSGDVVVRYARRFRLEKDDQGRVINPIRYWVDRGTPEPVRSALIDGASWWAQAFEQAGFPGGFIVDVLPEGAHPLDIRYNMINWVHRATRGWSYGGGIADPRTGEMIKGNVTLGSLRLRQDIKIFEALMGTAKTGSSDIDDPVEVALARVRQLSAHEVGHTLGLAHNMGASSYGGRASVMDYPAPDIRLASGRIDASGAYATGMGAWDIFAIRFLYGDYEGGDDVAAQDALMAEADADGLLYVPDRDSRPAGSGNRIGALWDNGSDAVAELSEVMALRRYALSRFGDGNLRRGEDARGLQLRFVPLYLYHRYQVAAAAKWIGGYDFQLRRGDDGRRSPKAVSWPDQARATDAIIATLRASALSIPEAALAALGPIRGSDGDPQFDREVFDPKAAPAFDYAGAVANAADLSLSLLMHPARLARLSQQGATIPGHPGISGVLARVTDALAPRRAPADGQTLWLTDIVLDRYASALVTRYRHAAGVDVEAALKAELAALAGRLERRRDARARLIAARIEAVLSDEAAVYALEEPRRALAAPPGSPIGQQPYGGPGPSSGSSDGLPHTATDCWHCDTLAWWDRQ